MALGLVKQRQVVVSYMGFSGVRPAGNDLHTYLAAVLTGVLIQFCRFSLMWRVPIARLRRLKVSLIFKEVLPCCIIPVQCKPDLEADYRFPRDPKVGVPPVTERRIL